MDSVPNFSSIIHSPSFTFLVGPQHTKLTIQSGIAQHVSKPLHNLMNGPTRESKHRIAVLEEDDVETFVAFCEYAYTGDYNVPRREPPVQEYHKVGVVETSPSSATWRGNHRSGSMSSTIPPPAPSPPPQHRHRGQGSYYQPAPEPEPPVPQPVSEPAPAEVEESVTPTNAPEPEALFHADTETETYHEAEAAPAPAEDAPSVDEWAVPTEEPVSWEPEEPKANKKKGKKGKKGKKQAELVDEEPPAPAEPVNLTPPSTPPPEVAAEPVPEPEAEPVAEWAPAEPTPEQEQEQEQTGSWEQPAEETAREPEPVLAPEEPKPAEEQSAPAEAPMEDSWIQDRGEGTSIIQTQRQRPMLDMTFAQQQATSPCEPGLSLWDEFTSLQYDEPAISKPAPVETPSTELPYITFHAKVYVFATRYLIPALAQLCLRKLHRDLLTLSSTDFESADPSDSQVLDGLAATKAQMVLELVHYAYTKTARLEPISPTSATQLRENQLRRLVVHYAACNVKELSRYHSADDSGSATPCLRPMDGKDRVENSTSPKSLRALLDLTTELASDLVYRMM